jgi:hypothetical protein
VPGPGVAYLDVMVEVLGAVVAVFGVLLVVGGITGRIKVSSCCGIADPRNDLRMRGAFDDDRVPAELPDGKGPVHSV